MSSIKVDHDNKPNIILIMADDMGFSDIGCYGSEISTPHLDRLAKQGVRMTQMYNCARCCPTRASMLTGLYPTQAGVGHMIRNYGIKPYQGYLRDDAVTIAEVLKEAGYHTGMSGKWHIGGRYTVHPKSWTPGDEGYPIPTQRGFDRYYGTLCGAGSYYEPHTLMAQDQFIQLSANEDYYYTDAITDHAVSMLDEFGQESVPFFMYVAYTAPHWPLHALPEDIAKYDGLYKEGWDELRKSRYDKLIELGIIEPYWPLSPRDTLAPPWEDADHPEWEEKRMAVYAAQIDRMDQGIGKLMNKLRELQKEENTIVFFLSDNGGCAELLREDGEIERRLPPRDGGSHRYSGNTPSVMPGGPETYMSYDLPWANASNTPFRLFKHWVHEGGISTPFIMHWPDGLGTKGRMVHQPAHVIDIMATCLEVSGAKYPSQYNNNKVTPYEGESLLPLMKEDQKQRTNPIFWEHEGNRAVRDGSWKLVSRHGEGWELYHIDQDRTEMNDLAEKYPDRVMELVSQYESWARRCGVLPWNQVIQLRKQIL